MMKDFDGWHRAKSDLDQRQDRPTFQQQQVWWCNLGVNVGHEENGKGRDFSRPVLVVKKYNTRIFLGVPLTTQIKETPHYFKIHFKEREQCAMLTQIRVWDCKRMINFMGKLSDSQSQGLKNAIKNSL